MKITRTRTAAAALAASALAGVAFAGPLLAQPDAEPAPEAPPVEEAEEGFECAYFDDWVPTAEELAEINAETDALVKHLADNGINVEIETDELGFTYPALDENTDDATWDLVDSFYTDLYGDFDDIEGDFDEDFDDWVPTAEELAEINAETDALVKHLADNGINVEIETDELGFTYPALDENTDDATWDLVDSFYTDLYGDIDEDFEDWVPTAEELAEINAETDALVKHLADNGINVEIETDELGFTYPALDENTDDATWDLVDSFYTDLYGDIDEGIDFADIEGDFDDCEPIELNEAETNDQLPEAKEE